MSRSGQQGAGQLEAIPSGTVTLLFTDIEGSTKLLERLRGEYAALLVEQRDLLRQFFAKWNGHEIDTQGDSFFVTFARAADAVSCAVEAQRALASHQWPQGAAVRVRMGLHTGEPIVAGSYYVGMDVHLAARIASAGHGGQVLLSQTTRDLICQDLPTDIGLRDLGTHKLKDIRYAQSIYQVDIRDLPNEFPPLKALSAVEEPPTPGQSPFKGLQYYDEADADIFFGRELAVAKLADRMRRERYLAVIGASGSGKSSIVRAGLVPALKKAGGDGVCWRIYVMTPTAHPLEALAAALTRGFESVSATITLMQDLARDSRSLHIFVRKMHAEPAGAAEAAETRVLLVVDQFEELYTLCRSENERRAFVDNLLHAVQSEGGAVSVVLTLRADFYEHLAQHAELREAVSQHQEYIGPMDAAELRLVIEEPANRAGWEFAPGLVDLMLQDIGAGPGHQPEPGALPLLSHALLETWKRRRGTVMSLKGYAEAGGVRGAIAKTAESVYRQRLTSEERPVAQSIFLRLTELGEGTQDTRRRVAKSEIIPSAPPREAARVESVIQTLADARLITTGENTIEVAHEALIREWPTLREWLAQNREGLRLHRHLTDSAQEWERLGHDAGLLYRGVRLGQALEWAERQPREMNLLEWSFLEASKKQAEQEQAEREEQRRRELEVAQKLAQVERQRAQDHAESNMRLRRRALFLTAAVVVAALGALAAGIFARQANENTNLATSRELAAAAVSNLKTNPELSMLLAMQAERTRDTWEAQNALHQSVLASRLRAAVSAHDKPIHGIAQSPDGQYVASAGDDETIRVWPLSETGFSIGRSPDLAIPNPLDFVPSDETSGYTIAFSPDGTRLAAIAEKHTAKIWDARTGNLVQTLVGHSGNVVCVAFSPDGSRLATCGSEGSVKLWSMDTASELETLAANNRPLVVAFDPDGRVLAVGGYDGTVQLWEVGGPGPARQVLSFETDDSIQAVTFSPNGKRLLVAPGGTAQLWDQVSDTWSITPTLSLNLRGHQNAIIGSHFIEDGSKVVTGGPDGMVKIWDAETGQELVSVSGGGPIFSFALSADGTRLVTGHKDGRVMLWDVSASGNQEWFSIAGPYRAQIGTNGDQLMTLQPGGRQEYRIRLYTVLPDGIQEERGFLIDPGGSVTIGSFTQKLDRIGLVTRDMVLQTWEAPSGMPRQSISLSEHQKPIFALAFSADGSRALTGSDDGTAVLWDLTTGKALLTLAGHGARVRGLAFSADASLLATGSADGSARLWDAKTGNLLGEFHVPDGEVATIALSPNGNRLLTGSRTVRIWDVSTGKQLLALLGLSTTIFSTSFSPDGSRILSGGVSGVVQIWDASNGQELLSFPGVYAQFSPDGRNLLTTDLVGMARGFYLDVDDLLRLAQSRVTRSFRLEECIKYLHAAQCPTVR